LFDILYQKRIRENDSASWRDAKEFGISLFEMVPQSTCRMNIRIGFSVRITPPTHIEKAPEL
jgi:hypothetical protein